jgi:hypothetical protein
VLTGGHAGRRNCPVTIYIDNVLYYSAQLGQEPPGIDFMQASDFAAAEYYASAAETPPQYNATGSGCGALLLWTRD